LATADESSMPKRWTKKQLEEGICVTAPAMGMTILHFAPEFDAAGGRLQKIDNDERRKYLELASHRKAAN
jgi:hypothetical protein